VADGSAKRSKTGRVGRVETGLERDFLTRRDIGPAERSALRAQARAVDVAELAHDADAVSRANAVYLDLRKAAGLSSGGVQPVDAFDALLAELARPGAGASDVPNS
jgi:hypothetical protein